MSTKVKGLLKGLRYISQIFDEKEPEMQIGHPTDVKHVAHIGWDGPSANTPTWMGEFNATQEVPNGPSDSLEESKSPAAGKKESLLRSASVNEIPRPRLQQISGTASPVDSPKRTSDAPKHTRRHRSTNNVSADSPGRDSPGSSRHARRNKNSNIGNESPSKDLPAVPKHTLRRRGTSSGGSTRRSSDQISITDSPFTDHEAGGNDLARIEKQ